MAARKRRSRRESKSKKKKNSTRAVSSDRKKRKKKGPPHDSRGRFISRRKAEKRRAKLNKRKADASKGKPAKRKAAKAKPAKRKAAKAKPAKRKAKPAKRKKQGKRKGGRKKSTRRVVAIATTPEVRMLRLLQYREKFGLRPTYPQGEYVTLDKKGRAAGVTYGLHIDRPLTTETEDEILDGVESAVVSVVSADPNALYYASIELLEYGIEKMGSGAEQPYVVDNYGEVVTSWQGVPGQFDAFDLMNSLRRKIGELLRYPNSSTVVQSIIIRSYHPEE